MILGLIVIGSIRFWILVICLVIGLIVFSKMLWMSRGGYKYSSFRNKYDKDYEDARQNYNRGIFPTLGCVDDDWSYSEIESYTWS